MERRKEIQRAMYAMMTVDAALLFLLAAISLRRPSSFMVLAVIYLPTVLISNFFFLRRKLKVVGPPTAGEDAKARPNRFSLYGCSAIFFTGTLYGVLMISQGELPRTILPLLLLPLSLAVYCLRGALQSATRTPKPDNAEPNRSR